MKKRATYILFSSLALSAWGADDVIIFKNGDTLSGTILNRSETRIYLKADTLGLVSFPLENVDEVRKEGNPTAQPQPKPAAPQPKPPAPKNKIPPPGKYSKWSGQLGFSLNMQESNTLTRNKTTGDVSENENEFEDYSVFGNVKWTGGPNELRLNLKYRYKQSEDQTHADIFNITQHYKYDFSKKYYAKAKTMFQNDFRRGRENLQSAEIGVKWINTPSFNLSTSGGGAYHEYERPDIQYEDERSRFIFDQSIRWKLHNALTFFQQYTHLGDLEEYHFVFSSGIENTLVKDLIVRFEYRLDRDTDVIYNDRGYYDKSLKTSLLYKF